MLYFVLSSFFIFLNSKTYVVTILEPFNSINKSISLILIANSVSVSCISWLKKFKISTLQVLAQPLSVCDRFVIFAIFTLLFKFLSFVVSLYKAVVGFLHVLDFNTLAFLRVCQCLKNDSCLERNHIKEQKLSYI